VHILNFPCVPAAIYISGMVSLVVAVLLAVTKRVHGRLSMDGLCGIQKVHLQPTPRIGGIAIVAGVIGGWVVSSNDVGQVVGVLIAASVPAFFFGVLEDLTKRVSVVVRLCATMASGGLAWWLSGVSLTHVGLPFLDSALGWIPFSVLFTAFAVGGIANAVNIIDGLNGLAGGFIVVALGGIAVIASFHGDSALVITSLVVASAVLGFWLVNWPFGKIFLGDGGSYFGGFAFAWICVLLVERSSAVSAFAPVLVCIHPVSEVLFSIYRRKLKKANIGCPDRLHLHSLIMLRCVVRVLLRWNGGNRQKMLLQRNSVAGLMLALMSVPSTLVAVWVADDFRAALGGCLFFLLVYVTIYARLVRFRWCSPLSFLLVKRLPQTVD